MSNTNSDESAIFQSIARDVLNAVLYGSQKNRRKMTVSVDDCQDSRPGLPSRSAIVPEQVYIGRPSAVFGQSVGVFASTVIPKGTVMGPYVGRRFCISQIARSSEMNIEREQLWEVLRTDGQLDHFVGMSSSDEKNWMTFVNCARHVSEQTLDMVQIGWNIYYIANKDIFPHEELLVWYSESTNLFFGIPVFNDGLHTESTLSSKFRRSNQQQPGANFISHRNHQKDGCRESLENRSIRKTSSTENVFHATSHLSSQHTSCWSTAEVSTDHRQSGSTTQENATVIVGDELSGSSNGDDRLEVRSPRTTTTTLADLRRDLRCPMCGRMFNTRSNLRSHTRIHTLEKPFTCRFCQRGFSQSSTLRNHLRLHTGEKPYRCNDCQCSYSQLAGLRAHQRSVRHRNNADTVAHLPMTAQPYADNTTR